MLEFLDSNALLSQSQFGFRQGRSALSQLFLSKSRLVECFNDRACVDCVLNDLSKAFDSISYKKLLIKLHAHGIHNSIRNWIVDFLTHRLQRVTINNCSSSRLPCTSGFDQGSILGPMLFIIYINYLPNSIMHSDIFLFADDTKILKRIDCRLDCLLLQRDIDSFAAWCDLWQLKLNISKCVYVRFGVAHWPTFPYCITNVLLHESLFTKDLGAIFDSKLVISEHCKAVASKGFACANMLLRCFHSRDRTLQMKLFKIFVRPVLEYNSLMWSPHLFKNIISVEHVQRYFIKNLRGLKCIPCNKRLLLLEQLSLELRRTRANLIFLYKILHGLVDTSLKKNFVAFTDVSRLRGHAFRLVAPRPNSDTLKYDFVYRSITCWKSLLGPTIRRTRTVNA